LGGRMKFYPGKLSVIAVLATMSTLSLADYVDTDIIDSSNLSDVGFTLQGINPSLNGNTVLFPEAGHYCVVKDLSVDFKAGETVTLNLNSAEAADSRVSLRVLTWGTGNYKGFGGRSGANELSAELAFDTSKMSVGFCRYNNTNFDEFEISSFTATHTKEVEAPAPAVAAAPSTEEELLPVYPACREYDQDPDSPVLIVDESETRSLQEMFNDGTIVPGMVVLLRRDEAALTLHGGHKNFISADAPWLTIIGDNNATIESIGLSYVKNIRFAGLNIQRDTSGFMVSTYDTENIVFDHNYISGGDNSDWDAQKWQEVASGIMFRRGKCSTAYRNELENLRMGISTYVRDNEMRQEIQSLKVLVKENLIKNISADFLRPLGSDITFDGNVGLDHYVSGEDGDANHDDFIQGFAYPLGTEFQNVKIINNFYQSNTDPDRAYKSDGQGIAVFDGLYTDFEITNNTIISNHWHGITILWGKNGVIANNTVSVSDDSTGRYMWIESTTDKSGKYAPENIKVMNNVANHYKLHSATTAVSQNNVRIDRNAVGNNLTTFDAYDLNFDVSIKEDSYYYQEGVGSSLTTLEKAMDNLLN